ncbi:hypothetical protein KJ819_02610 [Patescibacteria group bacterium]|nr:hypothetical protein [Patescibacteria group bacterium]MBU1500826.1 hypothetical protein [Patescibacteria group bacterium]MBU2080881.1 hypothetical protein [Patescibacteria group bacterium]MBU2123986.1 hypothetical protein [Patescibacteria group bacterium]MBU2194723.1 hypothetical protein [Patescibacteria group bacterium]
MEKLTTESGNRPPEKVVASAIIFRGQRYTGVGHVDAVAEMEKDHPDWLESKEPIEDGFVTDTGRFVDRKEGGEIAGKASQLEILDYLTQAEARANLDSEDLSLDSSKT